VGQVAPGPREDRRDVIERQCCLLLDPAHWAILRVGAELARNEAETGGGHPSRVREISGDGGFDAHAIEPELHRVLNEQVPRVGRLHRVHEVEARMQRLGLAKLRWLVVRDFVETETAAFWHTSPELEAGELRTELKAID